MAGSTPETPKIALVRGRAVPVRGDDIDTDRIMPARFLRCVTFEGIEEHAFEDDRRQLAAIGQTHSFDDQRFRGASVLLVNHNFGCGSSREHAPQALVRWGIRAVVGESFAEIFFGNCLALGVPCVTVSADDIEKLMEAVERDPELDVAVDLESCEIRAGNLTVPAKIPQGPRDAFLEGAWDATGALLRDYEQVRSVAGRLPYVAGFRS